MATPTHSSSGGKDDDDNKGSSGGGGKGGSSAADDYAKEQKKQQKKAEENYKKQAETLQGQIDAIRDTIHGSFLKNLKIRLNNIKLLQGQQDAVLVEGYQKRLKDLSGAKEDNDKSFADDSFAALANRGRERLNALTEATLNGAGESDTLKAQVMSLRNWGANQGEINRSMFDTLRSINTSRTDLINDTKTARINNATQANEERDQLYTNYYQQRYEGMVQLGNLLGQQAELYGLANEKGDQKGSSKDSGKAFDAATKEAAKAWENPGVKQSLRDWQGAAEYQTRQSMGDFSNAATNIGQKKKPEGASLRRWDT